MCVRSGQLFVRHALLCFIAIFLFASRQAKPKKNAVTQSNQTQKLRWMSIAPGSSLYNSADEPSRVQKLRDAIHKVVAFHQRNPDYGDEVNATGGRTKKKKVPMMFPWWTVYIAWARKHFFL